MEDSRTSYLLRLPRLSRPTAWNMHNSNCSLSRTTSRDSFRKSQHRTPHNTQHPTRVRQLLVNSLKHRSPGNEASKKTTPMIIQHFNSYSPTAELQFPSNSRLTGITPNYKLEHFHTSSNRRDLNPRNHTPANLYNSPTTSLSNRRNTITTDSQTSSLPTSFKEHPSVAKRPKRTIMGRQALLGSLVCQIRQPGPKAPNSSLHQRTTPSWSNSKRPRTLHGSRLPTFSPVEAPVPCKYATVQNSKQRRRFGQTKWYVPVTAATTSPPPPTTTSLEDSRPSHQLLN